MRISLVLQTLLGLQGIAALHARTVAAVEQDLVTVSTGLTNFDSALHAFVQGGRTLILALAVNSDTAPSTTALSQTLTDVQTTIGISGVDAATIEQAIVSIENIVIDICLTFRNSITPSTTVASIRTLVQQDVTAIINAFDALLTAAQGATPSPVSSQFGATKVQVDASCDLNGGPIVPI